MGIKEYKEWFKKERRISMVSRSTCEELEQRIKELEKGALNHIRENKALQESERRFRSLFENAVSAILYLSLDYRIVEFNPEAERLYGWKREEVLGKNYLELFILEEERDSIAADIDKVLSGKPTKGFENNIISRDGNEHVLTWNINRWLDSKNRAIGVVAVGQDITNRKRGEKALRESELRYTDLYDNSPDMYVSVDAKTTLILRCNQTLADKLGYSKEEIVGCPIFDMYHADCLDLVKKTFRVFVETGEVSDAELQLKRKDGSKIDVSLNVTAVRDKNGKILYSRSSWRDITQRKLGERALLREKDRLQEAIKKIKTLSGLLPICATCKKIRDDKGYWSQIESYIREHSDAEFSHSICPDCAKRDYPDLDIYD